MLLLESECKYLPKLKKFKLNNAYFLFSGFSHPRCIEILMSSLAADEEWNMAIDLARKCHIPVQPIQKSAAIMCLKSGNISKGKTKIKMLYICNICV